MLEGDGDAWVGRGRLNHQRADRGQGDDKTRQDILLAVDAPTPQFAGRSARLPWLPLAHASCTAATRPPRSPSLSSAPKSLLGAHAHPQHASLLGEGFH